MTRPILIIALAFAVIATFAQAQESDSDVRESLIEFNQNFNRHAANHDIEGLVALYHEDAYWIAPNALPAKGRDGVPRKTITFMSKNKGQLTHTIDELFIASGGLQAVMMGITDAAVPSANVAFKGTYIYVLQRDSVEAPWRIVVDMFNNHPTN